MNRNRKEGHARGPATPRLNGELSVASPSPRARAGLRNWAFRAAAVLLVPVLVIVGAELGLRLAGYGYSTALFRKTQINGRTVFAENDKFGLRFFPPGLARSPAPIVLPADKAANTYRIFVFGESAALGDPKPAYGFHRYLEVLLQQRYPGIRFEVVCVAMTAINSHAIVPMARECAGHRGDLWVVYMGHNEMEGPFGAGGALGRRTPSPGLIKASVTLKGTRVGQLLDSIRHRLGGPGDSKSWSGLKMFVGSQIAPDDPGRRRVEGHFRDNLDQILQAGVKAGVKVVLCTVASNLKDCAPYASMHPAGLTGAQKQIWDKLYKTGTAAESAGRWETALGAYSQAARLDARFAELQFRIGRCAQARTNFHLARRSFELARDYDALPFRATSSLNQIVKEAAMRNAERGVGFLDASEVLAGNSPDQIPGDDLFFDHVHFNFDGNYRLARAVAGQVSKLLPEKIASQAEGDWLTAIQCEVRLALTDWNRYLAYEGMLVRLSDVPYTNQLNDLERARRYLQKLSDLKTQLREGDRRLLRAVYEQAVAKGPEDHYLHQSYAEFLETTGDLAGAVGQWKQIQQAIPHHPVAYFQAGRLLGRQAKFSDAEQELMKAVSLRPDFAEAIVELAQALAKQDRKPEAIARFNEGLRLNPENAAAHLQLADVLAAQGQRPEALEHLREAVRLRPAYWEARYFLGVELAVQDKVQDAAEQFAEVVRLRPDHALAHLNLGVALAKQRRFNEALAQFQETLRLDPKNTSAQKHVETIQALRSQQTP